MTKTTDHASFLRILVLRTENPAAVHLVEKHLLCRSQNTPEIKQRIIFFFLKCFLRKRRVREIQRKQCLLGLGDSPEYAEFVDNVRERDLLSIHEVVLREDRLDQVHNNVLFALMLRQRFEEIGDVVGVYVVT